MLRGVLVVFVGALLCSACAVPPAFKPRARLEGTPPASMAPEPGSRVASRLASSGASSKAVYLSPSVTSGPLPTGDVSPRLVASGSDGSYGWTLRASRSAGHLCMLVKTTTVHGGGSSNGCDYKLPLDESELGGADLRVAYGCVTSAAAKVVLHAKDGETWTASLQGANAGFGHGFYMAKIGVHAIIDDVKAFDGQGRVVGEMKPDQTAERMMASPPPL